MESFKFEDNIKFEDNTGICYQFSSISFRQAPIMPSTNAMRGFRTPGPLKDLVFSPCVSFCNITQKSTNGGCSTQ